MPAAIQPISRALQVMVALNRRPLTTVDVLHQDTGLPKSTVVRLLHALSADGYVEQMSRSAGYRLSAKVLMLSAGYRQRDLLVEVARPLMDRYAGHHKWPLYLASADQVDMALRYRTAEPCPGGPHHQEPGDERLSLLVSAPGQAYLAFCPAAERRQLLKRVAVALKGEDGLALDERAVVAILTQVRDAGYASTAPLAGDRGAAIALPVRHGRRVVGAVAMGYFGTALNQSEAVQRYLGPMQQLAAEIGTGLRQARKLGAA